MSPDYNETGDDLEPVPHVNLEDPQSLNQYAYVGNNPLTFVDVDGHSKDCGGGGDKSAVCLVTSFWDWLTSGSSNGSSNSSHGVSSPAACFRKIRRGTYPYVLSAARQSVLYPDLVDLFRLTDELGERSGADLFSSGKRDISIKDYIDDVLVYHAMGKNRSIATVSSFRPYGCEGSLSLHRLET
jgi:hypothetical protein